ncbi:MAG: Asp-tRNA(Asn)/Glu-tRNA(Gln) amidotransferase subunit GatA [Clostridia bacterium]|nr:Asp-tRNA(Asn)/Glu-tRNA(Gln) amidotransferase subunit GatA [Clostridia bacterium]
MSDLLNRTILAHHSALEAREYSAVELTQVYLDQIAMRESEVGAFLTLDAEGALRAAEESDRRRLAGKARGMLDGIPFSLKDNIAVKDMRLTCASRLLRDYVSPYDATVALRLKQAGAVLLGKNNMDEFAMGSSTEYSALGVTRNPWDPSCVPGGSSGGSAAAVAAKESVFSLGSDTGGSVRQPAAFCGVYGLKPTYGVLSRYGVVAMASSLDCVGVLTETAQDCAAVLECLVGKDLCDATSVEHPQPDFLKAMRAPLRALRVATVSSISEELVDADVWQALQSAAEILRDAGAVIETVELPVPKQALAAYSVLAAAEASSNLARYDGVHYGMRSEDYTSLAELYANTRGKGFGDEVKRRILFGTDMLLGENRARFYVRAQHIRERIRCEMKELLSKYDLILTPTSPTVAFARGSSASQERLACADMCTVYASLAGVPAVSVPFGKNENGLPLAVQLTGRAFSEGLLLRTAKLLEEALG